MSELDASHMPVEWHERVAAGDIPEKINEFGHREYTGTFLPTDEEHILRIAKLTRQAQACTGVALAALRDILRRQPLDPEPAQALLERYANSEYPLVCKFGLATLEIDEGVFSPSLTSASPFLLDNVDFKAEHMLDAFAGSGAFAINAALSGGSAVTFDTSQEAAVCATKNAALNGVTDLLDVRHGTLRECLSPNEKFDLITANPPLIAGEPQSSLERALFDPGLQATKEFVAALPELLVPRGRCYLLTSDVIDRTGYEYDLMGHCRQNGLRTSVVAELHRPYETYRVHKIQHRRLATWRSFRNQFTYLFN